MAFLELTGIQKRFGESAAVQDFNLAAERGEFVLVPRAVRLRQDDDAPDDRRLRAPDRRLDPHRRHRHHRQGPQPAQRRDGLPVVRPLPEHDRRRQRRVRPEGPQAARATRSASGWPSCSSSSTCPTRPTAIPGSCPAASSSGSPWPAPSPSSPRSSSSTSRCPPSTRRSGSSLRNEIRAIQRQLGITTVYVTHDQEEALSLSDRIVVMSEGRIEQIGTPFEIYNFPATGVRGLASWAPSTSCEARSSMRRPADWRSPARRSGPRRRSRERAPVTDHDRDPAGDASRWAPAEALTT